ncbi:trypsin-like peptidase domain-containing protein [Blastococcus sp. BMG 814]|uniref:Trypsin-like peptidase domain-containing protein n=1 Tax=Blastococcus carthaginiensis TaxID=3050034 RepID=A0ABT9I7Q1_9ACTN|nr:trypsin-like peptidase domain-containing protein [Blastococcus carthaginiensis]MDP5181596.1 trypsin-like peptidase domain-containing protein [Blastococcus carthaginiensis]
MSDEAELAAAIRDHPLEAAGALAAVQAGWLAPLTVDSLVAALPVVGGTLEQLWIEQLAHRDLLDAFVGALQARGVPVGAPQPAADHVDPERLVLFGSRAKAFRCRVLVNGAVAGTGCLIGPSLVLTAWHVVAVQPPGRPQEPAPRIHVVLADSTVEEVALPLRFESFCGDAEYTGQAPRADADVDGRNDVAVLVMRRPAAAHLGRAELPEPVSRTASRTRLVLVHFPDGEDRGFGWGYLHKIRNVTARWRHDITTAQGSSGGACFDSHLELAGVHQGRWNGKGRLVPLSRFAADLRPLVEDDVAPRSLWSLDGTATGALVIGRDVFVHAVAAAGDERSRVRGVRVKRRETTGGTTGLNFSHHLLGGLLARRGAGQVIVRVSFDELVRDLVEDIRGRVAGTGLPLADLPPSPGLEVGLASPEAAARDRARLLAAAVEAAAAAAGRTVWFFFDTPSVVVPEPARLLLEGFVAAALRKPHLRLVVAGFETLALPGEEFATASAAAVAGPPGLVVEYLGGFTRADVLDLLTRAHEDLTGRPPLVEVVDAVADPVLAPLRDFNGVYAASDLPAVAAALRPDLQQWQRDGREEP